MASDTLDHSDDFLVGRTYIALIVNVRVYIYIYYCLHSLLLLCAVLITRAVKLRALGWISD